MLSLTWLSYLGQFDQEWTRWLRKIDRIFSENGWAAPSLKVFARGSDPAILFILASFLLYFVEFGNPTQQNDCRSGVPLGVHHYHHPAVDWVMFTALNGSSAELAQILFGISNGHLVSGMNLGQYIAEGVYRGSFPSGHTAVVLVPMLLSLIWLTDFKYQKAKVSDLLGNRLYSAMQ